MAKKLFLLIACIILAHIAFSQICDIKKFLDQCPTSDPAIDQILSDFEIRLNDELITDFDCYEPVSEMNLDDYNRPLIWLQTLRTIYYMDQNFSEPIPWSDKSLYNWIKESIDGIDIVDNPNINGAACCYNIDGKNFIKVFNGNDSINRESDRSWFGMAGNIAVIAHEARHANNDGYHHSSCCGITGGCDDIYDINDLSTYGVQHWLFEQWLKGSIDIGIRNSHTESEVNLIINSYLGLLSSYRDRFCTVKPDIVNLDDIPNPLGISRHITETVSICEGDNYFGLTEEGSYDSVFVASNGCDSIRTINLVVKPIIYSNDTFSTCDPFIADSMALVALYHATDGDNWTKNTNWFNGPLSTWLGVTVQNGRVKMLNLNHNNLTGYIPEEIGLLSDITHISLNNNNLEGELPEEITNLYQLFSIDISYNSLNGQIPKNIALLSDLYYLILNNNNLSGAIPEQIGNCENLYFLVLNNNKLDSISESIWDLKKLSVLDLRNNLFSGPIPHEIGNLNSLKSLYLSGNKFSGTIPDEIANLTALSSAILSYNNFIGPLNPDILANLPSLSAFWINNNKFYFFDIEKLLNEPLLSTIDFRYKQQLPEISIENITTPLNSVVQIDIPDYQKTQNESYQLIRNNYLLGEFQNLPISLEINNDEDFNSYFIKIINSALDDSYSTASFNIIKQLSSEASIVEFGFSCQLGETNISKENSTISITMPYGYDISNLMPYFSLSPFAVSSLSEGVSYDFSKSFPVTVTAEDGINSQVWTINVNTDTVHVTEYISICQGENYEGFSEEGEYQRKLIAAGGCDSFLVTVLKVNPNYYEEQDISICEGSEYNGHRITETFQDTYTTITGCDSIIVTNLTVTSAIKANIYISICEGENYHGYSVTTSFSDTLVSSHGCDSVVTTYLTVLPPIETVENITICSGETYKDWDTEGEHTETFTSSSGCDSMVITHLTILEPIAKEEHISICDGEEYLGHTESETFERAFTSLAGCDSVITTYLSVLPPIESVENVTICNGESYLGYNESTSFDQTFESSSGCDSIVTTHLTVLPDIETIENITICSGETYKGWNTEGEHIVIFTSNSGCDSTVITNLTFYPTFQPKIVVSGDTITSVGTYLAYQWFDESGAISGATDASYNILKSGDYWLQVTDENGCTQTSEAVSLIHSEITNQIINGFSYSIIPNPNNGQFRFQIESNPPANLNLTLINSLGQTLTKNIIQNPATGEQINFNVNRANKGIYFLLIQSGEILKSEKIVIH